MDLGTRLDAARAWAAVVLERAGRGAARLEPARTRVLIDRRAARPVWEVDLEVWEPAGAATVRLGGHPEVTLGAGDQDGGSGPGAAGGPEAAALPPDDPRAVAAEALAREAARREALARDPAAAGARWRARAARAWAERGAVVVGLAVERRAADGEAAVRLDATTGEPLGLACPLLLRGSRRSAALGQASAVARARAWLVALGLAAADAHPPRLRRARLVTGDAARTWRLGLLVAGVDGAPPREVALALNARTGALVHLRALRGGRAEATRAEAHADLQALARVRLGPEARVGAPIRGDRGGARVWLAVVHAADGGVYRATVERGRVRFLRIRAG